MDNRIQCALPESVGDVGIQVGLLLRPYTMSRPKIIPSSWSILKSMIRLHAKYDESDFS